MWTTLVYIKKMKTDDAHPNGPGAWTVREAKAKLSEVLRRAREDGPQRIGAREAFIVVTEEDWKAVTAPAAPLGQWLVQHLPKVEDFTLPDRQDPPRPSPFDEEA